MLKNKKNKRSARTFNIVHKSSDFKFVEAYKSLRTNLNFVSLNNNYKKLIVTGSKMGEGKTSVSINLAISLAENSSKVLLVDTDLRKPKISSYLHIDSGKKIGITSVLSGITELKDAIVRFTDLGIDVLTAGPLPPNPAEMIGSKAMEEVISRLEKAYDYIIFDTPPVSMVTDAAVLSEYCDGVILVIKQKYSAIKEINRAKQNLENVNANIIGCVLNDYMPQKDSTYGYGGNKYGYGYYYAYSYK